MALFAICSSPARAKFAPSIEWETVRTAHFRVHYPPSYRRFTAYLTAYLEEAYEVLSRDLHWQLQEPADVIVRGDTDLPNGFSSVFPFNRLVVDAVPFSPVGTIGEYDNWIRTLAYHELTHMIANDTTTGLFSVLRSIFGSLAKVNPYQPQWLVEGLAVYEETIHGIYGRGRSAFVDMVLRTAARDGLLDSDDPLLGVTLDRLNDGVPDWPGPVTSYFYGYVLHEMMVEAAGPGAPGALSVASGKRLPFFINGVAEEVLHSDYYGLWEKAEARLRKIAEEDLAQIRAQPVTELRKLTSFGRQSGGLASDGSRVYLIRDSYRQGSGLSALDPATGRVERLSDWIWGGGSQLRWRDGTLLYSRFEPYEEFKLYSDVFLWDLGKGREIRLTEGARAIDPDFSPEFRLGRGGRIAAGSLVYVKNIDDGNQALVTWNGREERVLYRGQRFERLASPAWGRGLASDWIAFTLKVNGANERLVAANARSGAILTITHHPSPAIRENEVTPSWTEQGDLLYAGSATGVFNLYRLRWGDLLAAFATGTDAPLRAERLTNVETGLIFPVQAPRGRDGRARLLAMAYGAGGFDAAELPDGLAAHPARPRALSSLRAKLHPAGVPGGPEEAPATPDPEDVRVDWPDPREDHPEGAAERYSAFPALWPKYWYPYGQAVADGWLLGLMTSGTDSLEKHQYGLSLTWDTRANFPLYDVRYQYDGLYPSIQLERLQEDKYLGVFKASNLSDTTSLTVTYPIGFWQVSFGGTVAESRYFGESNTSGGVQARFAHGQVDVYPDSIDRDSGEAGHRADVTFTGYFAGGDQFASVEGRWEQRIPTFWDQHFLRLFANGAHSSNPILSQLYFVGGGESNVTYLQSYLVRGYEPGAIFGRDIAALNLEYWLPLKDFFRGHGTLPAFYERAKLKLFVDAGSAEYVGGEKDDFTHWPVGVGVQLLQDVRIFYRVPLTVGFGFDWGLSERLGGEKQIVFGVMGRVN